MQADTKGTGIIEALDAAEFMKKFGLGENVLSEVSTTRKDVDVQVFLMYSVIVENEMLKAFRYNFKMISS